MPNPRRVFVDTSAYYALINEADVDHTRIAETIIRLTALRRRFFTTNFVLAEVHAVTLRRINRDVAYRALVEIERGPAIIVRVSARDERRAREILLHYDDKNFSLTDATSFAVMERLGITAAVTLDEHFAQFGFVTL